MSDENSSPKVNAKMKQFKPFLYFLAFMFLSAQVGAFWRILCHGQLGVVRVDPLADFGLIADHAHAAHGASSKLVQCFL